MSHRSSKKRPSLWRLARRLYGYCGRYIGVLIIMIAVMVFLACLDRGRAYLFKPFLDRMQDSIGDAIACDDCGVEALADKSAEFCANCGRDFKDERARLEERKDTERALILFCATCGQKNSAVKSNRHCSGCGESLDDERAAATETDPYKLLYTLGFLGLGASLLIFPLKYIRLYLANFLTNAVLRDIRNDINRHLLRQPLGFFHNRRSGDLISRVSNDTIVMQQSANFLLEDVFMQPLFLLAACALIIYTNWMLGVAAIFLLPLISIPMLKIGRAMRHKRKKSLERLGDLTEVMTQMYSGIRVVKAFGREKEKSDEFENCNLSFFRRMMRTARKKALADSIVEVFIAFAMLIVIVVGGFFFVQKEMTVGDIGVFILGIAMVNTPIKMLTKGYNRLQESMAAGERIFEILDSPPEPEDPPDAVDLPHVRESVEFRGVTFSYDSEPVLQDINLKASPGEVIAIVGRSGAGKSTLMDLVCRYYDPQGGKVLIDGNDLRRIRRDSLRKHVAVVAQETFLFNTTLGQNILYGRLDASQEEIEASAKAAHIHDFIQTLESKYDSVVGDRGAKLSGGQRQRVSIARAILKDPSILILDEATSSLDTEAEREVQAALNALIRGAGRKRITFVIAHRLSTVREADRIIVLDEGRIVEEGRHEDLLVRGGVYAQLHKMQFAEG